MLKTMTGKHADLSNEGAVWIPNDFTTGEALGKGDCFFDTLTQGVTELSSHGVPFGITSLQQACSGDVKCNQDSA
jgi:hypothetical protein